MPPDPTDTACCYPVGRLAGLSWTKRALSVQKVLDLGCCPALAYQPCVKAT